MHFFLRNLLFFKSTFALDPSFKSHIEKTHLEHSLGSDGENLLYLSLGLFAQIEKDHIKLFFPAYVALRKKKKLFLNHFFSDYIWRKHREDTPWDLKVTP